MTEMMKVVYLN